MKVRLETFWLPKSGSSLGEYEDAFYPDASNGIEVDKPFLSVAVADGATETSFSREWAKDLVEAYVAKPDPFYRSFGDRVQTLGARLNSHIERTLSGQSVPWYAEEKARQGAFAALLGLTISGDPNQSAEYARWRACAIGDCCVFQVRHRELLTAFPMKAAADFNNQPCLLPSRAQGNGELLRHVHQHLGRWQHGDEFYLMTDALACWFLRRWEQRSDPLELLMHLSTDAEFAAMVASERCESLNDGTPLLRNDDVTLMRCLIH